MSVLALVIVNSENYPVYIKTRYDYDKSKITEEENMTILYHINATLDIIEERSREDANAFPNVSREVYLGLLNHSEDYKIYGLLSATKVKIILMVSAAPNLMSRDTEHRNILKKIQSCYIDVTTNNPFYTPGDEVKSKILDETVKSIFGPGDVY